MKKITPLSQLTLSALLVFGSGTVLSDEWGSWDDLPDNLLTPSLQSRNPIDDLYDQLSKQGSDLPDNMTQLLEDWLASLDLEFYDNEDLVDLLEDLEGESDEEIQEAIDDWLEDQLDEMEEDAEDELDDLIDELEEAEKDHEDELDELDDDIEDALDEIDEIDEPDEPDEPESP